MGKSYRTGVFCQAWHSDKAGRAGQRGGLLAGGGFKQEASFYVMQDRRPARTAEFSEGTKGNRGQAVFKSGFSMSLPTTEQPVS